MIEKAKAPAQAILLILTLIIAFALVPLPCGDDWEVFCEAGPRVLSGEPLYGQPIYEGSFLL